MPELLNTMPVKRQNLIHLSAKQNSGYNIAKKIFSVALLLIFCVQSASYASYTAEKENNSETLKGNISSIKEREKYNYNYIYDNDKAYNSRRSINAFENNYQNLTDNRLINTELSPIEKIFNGEENIKSGKILEQTGYDMFTGFNQLSGNSGGKVDNLYKLSIGEKITAYLSGDSVDVVSISGTGLLSPSIKTEVDSKGNIFIQGIGMFAAENKSLRELETEINSAAQKKYKNLKVQLTLASGQEFSAYVFGYVNRPGRVSISTNSSVFDALNAAGGVKKTGTLRNIQYTSQGRKRNIDLYDLAFAGKGEIPVIKPNDSIYVNKIGDVIALKNGVKVPGIYEIKSNENIDTIINYAGGFLAGTQTNDIILTSLDSGKKERVASDLLWEEAKNVKLNNGDLIEFRELYNTAENIVTLQGNIKHPATYAYKEGMRLSDILKDENELLEETFITQAVIKRISGGNNEAETIPVYLKEFFSGLNDPLLKPRDIINVYKNTNSNFVDVYGCINTPKHLTYTDDMKLSDIMTDIQFLESDIAGSAKPVAYKGNIEENEFKTLEEAKDDKNRLIPAENVAVEIISTDGTVKLHYLYDIMINSDKIKTIALKPEDKIFFRTLRNNEIIKKVKISGFVKHPGVYTFVAGKKLSDMIETAGGLTDEAELRGIVFLRTNLQGKQSALAYKNNERDIKLLEGRLASGYKQTSDDQKTKMDIIEKLKEEQENISSRYSGQIALNIKNNDLAGIDDSENISVQDGDDIYIPRMSDYVSIIGEVYNEQSFSYKEGENAKYYIKEVGGYTPNANKFRLYKVGINGRAVKITSRSPVEKGDIIVVPRKIAGNDWISPICSTLQALSSVFLMVFAIKKW